MFGIFKHKPKVDPIQSAVQATKDCCTSLVANEIVFFHARLTELKAEGMADAQEIIETISTETFNRLCGSISRMVPMRFPERPDIRSQLVYAPYNEGLKATGLPASLANNLSNGLEKFIERYLQQGASS
jgi:hypothetical protein